MSMLAASHIPLLFSFLAFTLLFLKYSLHMFLALMFPAYQAQVGVGEIPPSAITVTGVVTLKV